METIKDLISVVIPTYNRAHRIKRSALSVLNQTYKNIELIIVDDGSTDNTEDVVKTIDDERVVYIKQTNQGACAARNNGIDHAKGEFIAFQDSDDVWCPEYLERCWQIIATKGAMFVTSSYYVVFEDGTKPLLFNEKNNPSGDISKKELYEDVVGPTPTVIVKKNVLYAAGLFDTRLPARQDYDMWIRVSKIVPLFYNYVPSVYMYRDGEESISRSYKRNMEGSKIVLEKIMADDNLSDSDKTAIKASHYKCMGISCVISNAYAVSRDYFKMSLKFKFSIEVCLYLVLSCFPRLFAAMRRIKRKIQQK